MNRKTAWTLAELTIAMIFIMVISGFLVSVFKPKTQNAKIQIYAAMRNIEKGMIAVSDKYKLTRRSGGIFYQDDESSNSNLCLEMSDAFSIKGTPNCTKEESAGYDKFVPNIVLSNGVEIYGLASKPITVIEGADPYINIMVDVDGPKGMNKLGVDRFPLRIFGKDSVVFPVNCGETEFYNWKARKADDKMITMTSDQKNPYCAKGKKFDKGASDLNFLLDEETITYDIYKINEKNSTETKNYNSIKLVRSFAEAICGTLGGLKYLSGEQCAQYGFNMLRECPTRESCRICSDNSYNVCPLNEQGTAKISSEDCITLSDTTEKDTSCFAMLHKPSAAMSAIVGAIVGDLETE